MIFNFWRRYPKRKPKHDDMYLCTTKNVFGRWILILRYNKKKDRWENTTRQAVFDGYQVYKVCRVPNEETRVWTDGSCEPANVIAWKKVPTIYKGKVDK